MTIEISYEAEEKLHIAYRKIIERVAKACLEAEAFPYETELSVAVTDGPAIRELNREYRGIDRETDVLSFPMLEFLRPGEPAPGAAETAVNPESGEVMLGDIVLNAARVREQAEEYGHTRTREFAFLVAHSMLHLLGYDHMEEEERLVMEARQRVILDGIGYRRRENVWKKGE
ncbi:MAG: rRNA maturation RNase YbeY [Stomatobaculum sp.]